MAPESADAARAFAVSYKLRNSELVTRGFRAYEIPEEDWDRAIDVNLKGTFLCTRAILPSILAHGGGSIVNISSVSGMRGYFPGFSAVSANYFASKAGIVGFTKQIAVEYAQDRIRANVISPAFHEGTALGMEFRSLRSAEQPVAFGASVDQRTPMGRKGYREEPAWFSICRATRRAT